MNLNFTKFSTITKSIFIICAVLCITACSDKKIDIDGFSTKEWLANHLINKNSCITYRSSIYKKLIEQQDKFKGMSEVEINQVFGPPNQEHISRRMRKSIFYDLDNLHDCHSEKNKKKFLVIDFETLRRVKTMRIFLE